MIQRIFFTFRNFNFVISFSFQVDRLWVIWQNLQQFRNLPHDKAYCALDKMAFPMKPFSWESNPNPHSRAVATPSKLFDYKSLGYKYDHLDFHGMNTAQLEKAINKEKAHDRAFAAFLLHGIKTSADVHLKVCNETKCENAGVLFVLGGETEMPWHFDRTYKMDITNVLKEMHIPMEALFEHDSKIHLEVEIQSVDGTVLDSNKLPKPSLIYVPAKGKSFYNVILKFNTKIIISISDFELANTCNYMDC